MKSKLTLNIDSRVVTRAKAYAKQNHMSLSALVEAYLERLVDAANSNLEATPVLQALRTLRHADIADYRKYLDRKFR